MERNRAKALLPFIHSYKLSIVLRKIIRTKIYNTEGRKLNESYFMFWFTGFDSEFLNFNLYSSRIVGEKNNTIWSGIKARLWCGLKSSFQIKCNYFYLSCDFHAFMHSFKSRNIQDDLMGLFLVYAIACREVVIKPIKSTKCILIMHLHKLDIWTQIKCTG